MSSKFQDDAAPITAAALPRTATIWSCVESRIIIVIKNCIKVSISCFINVSVSCGLLLIMKCYDIVFDYYIFICKKYTRVRHA